MKETMRKGFWVEGQENGKKEESEYIFSHTDLILELQEEQAAFREKGQGSGPFRKKAQETVCSGRKGRETVRSGRKKKGRGSGWKGESKMADGCGRS